MPAAWPPESGSQITAPMDKQPYITWLVRLGNAAQLELHVLDVSIVEPPTSEPADSGG